MPRRTWSRDDPSQLRLFDAPLRPLPAFMPDPPIPYSVPLYRVALVREGTISWPSPKFHSSRDAADLIRQVIGTTDREHFIVVLLDRRNHLIGVNTVSIGSATASITHPRECFKPALAPPMEQALWQRGVVHSAVGVIFGHNHPGGEVSPSDDDRASTARLVQAGKLLGIQVLDHVIVAYGTSDYFSFADNNLLD